MTSKSNKQKQQATSNKQQATSKSNAISAVNPLCHPAQLLARDDKQKQQAKATSKNNKQKQQAKAAKQRSNKQKQRDKRCQSTLSSRAAFSAGSSVLTLS
jgi:hypothetical protein